jgi:hypothetical protein
MWTSALQFANQFRNLLMLLTISLGNVRNRLNEGLITEGDADLIRLFVNELRATVGISNSRAAKITGQLSSARRKVVSSFIF